MSVFDDGPPIFDEPDDGGNPPGNPGNPEGVFTGTGPYGGFFTGGEGPNPADPPNAEAAAEAEQLQREKEAASLLRKQTEGERARRAARKLLDAEEQAEQAASRVLRIVEGWEFMYGPVEDTRPIWGDDDACGWSAGESCMLSGPPGVGKTTLGHLLILGRLGLVEEVLGLPVLDDGGTVFYIAGDRPTQIRKALRRHATPEREAVFKERLITHWGPLPVDITAAGQKNWLADQAAAYGATTVVVDSVKDVCPSPSEDGPANAYNLARQEVLARGVQVIEFHHNRKANGQNVKPNKLDDVYGNRWLTAGAGSVLSLWGDPGDRFNGFQPVELTQLKTPAGLITPRVLEIELTTGLIRTGSTMDIVSFVRSLGEFGVTVDEYHTWDRNGSTKQAARKRLDTMVRQGRLEPPNTDHPDGRQRWRVPVGVRKQKPQNVRQTDGL